MPSASRQIVTASLAISPATRRVGQPTARSTPISWLRSITDIAIVFVTPIPPTSSATTENTQPALISSLLVVSTCMACPGLVIATRPG